MLIHIGTGFYFIGSADVAQPPSCACWVHACCTALRDRAQHKAFALVLTGRTVRLDICKVCVAVPVQPSGLVVPTTSDRAYEFLSKQSYSQTEGLEECRRLPSILNVRSLYCTTLLLVCWFSIQHTSKHSTACSKSP